MTMQEQKEHNQQKVFDVLKKRGPSSIEYVALKAGLSISQVRKGFRDLTKTGRAKTFIYLDARGKKLEIAIRRTIGMALENAQVMPKKPRAKSKPNGK